MISSIFIKFYIFERLPLLTYHFEISTSVNDRLKFLPIPSKFQTISIHPPTFRHIHPYTNRHLETSFSVPDVSQPHFRGFVNIREHRGCPRRSCPLDQNLPTRSLIHRENIPLDGYKYGGRSAALLVDSIIRGASPPMMRRNRCNRL